MRILVRREEGITLIALVVTIVVLLILAGVSIGMTFDSNGLFAKVNEATTKWNSAKSEEEEYLKEFNKYMNQVAGGDDIPDGEIRDGYTDKWYRYNYKESLEGYQVEVIDKTLTTYGKMKTKLGGIPVKSFANTFKDCTNMTNIDLRGIDTSNVTNMSFMFSECKSITSLNLSSFNTSNVTSISYMFNVCNSLTNLDLSSFDTSSVTDMSNMFERCTNLKTIYVGTNWDTNNVTNSNDMFLDCGTDTVTHK